MIGILMLPQAGLIIPLYVVLARYHLTNTLIGVIITYMTFVLPFAVWTLRGFIIGIPRELEEAAMVDGSSRLGAFVRILLPLVAPGLVATSVFAFVTTWNEYIFASVLLSDQSNQTVTVWLSYFYGTSRNTDWGGLMAASTLTAIPVVVFFLIVQRRIAFGLTAGAVRGMSGSLERLANALHPARVRRASTAPDWLRRELDDGLGGVVLFARNVRDPDQLRRLDRRSASRPRRSSRSTRKAATSPASRRRAEARFPGQLALGAIDDVDAHGAGRARPGRRSSAPPASRTTSRRSPTSTRTR